ncbi:pyrroline-5-carboxylate reductase family protein, partial [Pseudomonas asplenii]
PHAPQRDKLRAEFGVQAVAQGDASLAEADIVVWAVKPQLFAEAAAPLKAWVGGALQLSVMAGIRSDSLVAATGSERVVRAMP